MVFCLCRSNFIESFVSLCWRQLRTIKTTNEIIWVCMSRSFIIWWVFFFRTRMNHQTKNDYTKIYETQAISWRLPFFFGRANDTNSYNVRFPFCVFTSNQPKENENSCLVFFFFDWLVMQKLMEIQKYGQYDVRQLKVVRANCAQLFFGNSSSHVFIANVHYTLYRVVQRTNIVNLCVCTTSTYFR